MAEKSTQHYFRNIDVEKKLISNIDSGILILDQNLDILYFNKWLEIHTHLKENEVIDKNLISLFPQINAKTLQRKIKTALQMGTPTFYTAHTSKFFIPIKINQIKASGFSHMRQDVSIIPFDIDQKLVALIITDQTIMANANKQLEENLKIIEELNRELIAEKKIVDERVLYIKVNHQFIITQLSSAYLQAVGFDQEDIYLKNLFEYEKLTITQTLKDQLTEHAREKKIFQYEKVTLTENGKEIWLQNTLVPDYDKNGEHVGFVIFSENITGSKLIQVHQEKMIENSRTTAMGEMISMIAHQWRQPLSVINTVIATLRIKTELGTINDEIIHSSYSKIEKTVTYLSDTIDDFRNFFKKNKEITRIKISSIFERSIRLISDDITQNGINYINELDENLEITTYENELVQTIINILKNSLDAFHENSIQNPYILIKSYEKMTHNTIEIEDNAGGIPEDIIQRITEPYFSTKSKNGTGLGLYVCKTIVEDHLNGKLTITSKNSKTKTIIELPKKLHNQGDEV